MGKLELISDTGKVLMFSPKYDGEDLSEFNKFLVANMSHSHPQLKKSFSAILSVIEKMGETGVYERYFRLEGGRIKALPLFVNIPRMDRKIGKMRLYCIRISDKLLILGSGAVTLFQKYQDDPVLVEIVEKLRRIDKNINIIAKQSKTNYDDLVAMKRIIESIKL